MVVEVRNLTKRYGSLTALEDFSLVAGKGEVVGIVGPNGAGKTTFFNLLLSVIKPTSGSFQIFGKQSLAEVRSRIGVSLEDYGFYPFLSGWDNLRIAANVKGVGKEAMIKVLKQVELQGKQDVEVRKYSFGMVKRLSIACALLNDPDLLILDEPTNGLDPVGIRQMGELVKALAQEGKTVIIANHLLGEIEKVCDRIIVLKEGRIVKRMDRSMLGVDTCFELYSNNVAGLLVALDHRPDFLILDRGTDKVVVRSESSQDVSGLIGELNAEGIVVSSRARKVTLEDIFHSLVNESR